MSDVRSAMCVRCVFFAALAVLLGGCSSRSYTITFDMPADNDAVVRVLGSNPFVTITNNGPGDLRMLISSDARGDLDDRIIGAMVTGRTIAGGGVLTLTSISDSTRVRIKADNADGVAVDHSPRPVQLPEMPDVPDVTIGDGDGSSEDAAGDDADDLIDLDDLMDDTGDGSVDDDGGKAGDDDGVDDQS